MRGSLALNDRNHTLKVVYEPQNQFNSNTECLRTPAVRRTRSSFRAGLTSSSLHGTKFLRPMKWRASLDGPHGLSVEWRLWVGFPESAVFVVVESVGCDPRY